ncbi:MAG: protein kinase [Planctomycetaceae bacterium]|jgi:serine/threonine protein kinase|nr:protein kinase [Planctomycetaceae bacterium]MBT4725120.1 protein kinase [Planctomycetaceae bacterium]MBT5124028.1 protein kinase [Planctomycetaceae bacterium]MBT5597569.1 protein kinase [Planctomycetaceae bacterium]MBT6847267.1 protein kinase [Planctomycetaceae bacterium]
MTSIDSPLVRTLLQARDINPSKSTFLQSLLALFPHHGVDMQATIDISDTLQEMLRLSALETGVDSQIINDLLEQYGFVKTIDPASTDAWKNQLDNNSTVDRTLPHPKQQTVGQRSTTSIPDLSRIINTSPNASIWSANDPVLDRQIVLKEYESAGNNPETSTHNETQFLREAQITGQLEHPNIIPVYAVSWNKDGNPFYTMKHIDGDTLTESIALYHRDNTQHTIMSLRPLLDIFSNICLAISYAHNRGVIHRDLKPSNIAIGNYGEVMVIDWGLGATPATMAELPTTTNDPDSREFHEPGQTLHGEYQGTPNYMSPEQATRDTVTQLSDVYSLGGVLFTILTGRPPRTVTSQSAPLSQMFMAIAAGKIPTVNNIEPSIPIQLVEMVNRAMQSKPENRYQDVESLLADLQSFLVDEPIAACPDTALRASARWIRKHPVLISISSAVLTLALISLSISNLVINKSNDQARMLLGSSRVLTQEAIFLRDQLATKHKEEAESQESALRNQQIAIDLQKSTTVQAALADSARTEAAFQLEVATKSAMDATLASARAMKSKIEAVEALQETEILKRESQRLAQIIRREHAQQLRMRAQHFIELNRLNEAILSLVTAITIPEIDTTDIYDMVGLANSLMDQGVSLSNISTTNSFSTNLLPRERGVGSTAMACVSPKPHDTAYQLLFLPQSVGPRTPPSIREIPSIPIAVLRDAKDDAIVVVTPQSNATSISIQPVTASTPPVSFRVGSKVTSAILSNTPNQLIVGTQTGGGFTFDLETGETKSILPEVRTPITALAIHANSSMAAFTTKSTLHIVKDPEHLAATISVFQLPSPAVALQFNASDSLVVVTSDGYVYEYRQLPKGKRITRFRPPTSGSKLRNISVHPSGAMLLDHSSNHLTLLNKDMVPTTVQSPLTISIRSMSFSSGGQSVLTTTDRRITTIWDCMSMHPRHLPMRSDHLVIAMELDATRKQLYTLHSDASLRTWNIPLQKTDALDNVDPHHQHTAATTLRRFKLMLSVRPNDTSLGITAAEARVLLATKGTSKK